jgi:CheY-like chemotaxis protein
MTRVDNDNVPVAKRPKAILCLCNDADMLRIRSMLLEHFGYTVLPTTSAEDAKQVMQNQCPDMVLMDNGVEPALDYRQLAEHVKEICPEVITVLLSPYFRLSVKDTAKSIDRVVAQDDGPDALISEIADCFAGSRPSGEVVG